MTEYGVNMTSATTAPLDFSCDRRRGQMPRELNPEPKSDDTQRHVPTPPTSVLDLRVKKGAAEDVRVNQNRRRMFEVHVTRVGTPPSPPSPPSPQIRGGPSSSDSNDSSNPSPPSSINPRCRTTEPPRPRPTHPFQTTRQINGEGAPHWLAALGHMSSLDAPLYVDTDGPTPTKGPLNTQQRLVHELQSIKNFTPSSPHQPLTPSNQLSPRLQDPPVTPDSTALISGAASSRTGNRIVQSLSRRNEDNFTDAPNSLDSPFPFYRLPPFSELTLDRISTKPELLLPQAGNGKDIDQKPDLISSLVPLSVLAHDRMSGMSFPVTDEPTSSVGSLRVRSDLDESGSDGEDQLPVSSGCGNGERKDEAYRERRRKNNEAAKKSRDARRAKEDEIAVKAAILEKENICLKLNLAALKKEHQRLMLVLR